MRTGLVEIVTGTDSDGSEPEGMPLLCRDEGQQRVQEVIHGPITACGDKITLPAGNGLADRIVGAADVIAANDLDPVQRLEHAALDPAPLTMCASAP